MKLTCIPPAESFLINLAPRVQGVGLWVGEYGYALALTHDKVRVLWDDGGGIADVEPHNVVFFADGGVSQP